MPYKSNRREKIIEVATIRFLISGYDVVTVDELCALTSSTKGSFYHFFANKESLAVDVVNDVWNTAELQLEEIFSSPRSAKKKLKLEVARIASNYVRFEGKRYFIGCPIGTLAVSLRGKSHKLTRRLNFALNHMHQFYTDAYTMMVLPGQDPAELADSLMVRLQGLSTLGKAYSNGTRIKQLAHQIQTQL